MKPKNNDAKTIIYKDKQILKRVKSKDELRQLIA